jgi:hypothetical protein
MIFFISMIASYIAIRRQWLRIRTIVMLSSIVNFVSLSAFTLTVTDNFLHIIFMGGLVGLSLTGTMVIMALYFENNERLSGKR